MGVGGQLVGRAAGRNGGRFFPGRPGVAGGIRIIEIAVELAWNESIDGAAPGGVAEQAFGTGGNPVGLPVLPAVGRQIELTGIGLGGILDRESHCRALRRGQIGVGLSVVPDIGVSGPVGAGEVEDLGFDPAPAGGIAGPRLDSDRFGEDAVGGKLELAADRALLRIVAAVDREPRFARQSEEAARGGAVGPGFGAHRIGEHAGGGDVLGGIGEETGGAELGGEFAVDLLRGAPHELVERAAGVVEDVEFAHRINAEAHDCQRRVGQFLLPGDLIAVVLERPHSAGDKVAVNVGIFEFRQPCAGIDIASGD